MVGDRAQVGRQGGVRMRFNNLSPVVPAKAGTHTPCPLDRLWHMSRGFTSAFTRVYDALWAGATRRWPEMPNKVTA